METDPLAALRDDLGQNLHALPFRREVPMRETGADASQLAPCG